MKILLLGDFSGLHLNLRGGLRILGHDVTLASTGDDWKNLTRDIDLAVKSSGSVGKIAFRVNLYKKLIAFSGYDIVQIINPSFFPLKLFPSQFAFDFLKKNNGKIFLSASGDDAFHWKYGRQRLRYSPHEEFLKYDLRKKSSPLSSKKCLNLNKYIADSCDGIIPIMHEYEASYAGHPKLKGVIPIPIDTDKINYVENAPCKKLSVFHGLNRYGFKGTRFVEASFKELSRKYPKYLDLNIKGKLPLESYLSLMKQTNIVVDQVLSYSCGMNAIYALAMGKVVLGGAEPESLISLGVKKSPVINITPFDESISDAIELLLEEKDKISQMGYESRQFAEAVHDYVRVAEMYIETWKSSEPGVG